METLINLLNEFDSGTVGLTEDLLRETGCTYCIICKPYGFIKWLVDNDKIDKEKIIKRECLPITDINEDYMLMLLAIQDNPINSLISMLK